MIVITAADKLDKMSHMAYVTICCAFVGKQKHFFLGETARGT